MVYGHVIKLASLVALVVHLTVSFLSHVQSLKLRVGVLEINLFTAVTPLNLVGMASRMAFDHSMIEKRIPRLPSRLGRIRSTGWLWFATGSIHTVCLSHFGPLADLDTELGGWRLTPILMAIILSGGSIHKIRARRKLASKLQSARQIAARVLTLIVRSLRCCSGDRGYFV